ncbi:hypothetical protein M0811_04952 [Anaeramoeba ignava]|uniref:Uncharacterized protein n=1 Tax=Anaeramoeba ignava TaxID=1746090 RepID=A0A9Q0RFX3_ANAIG|nr:hypothetical protein M0811_04952 [Anaeramoeba ignava]
MFQLFNNLFNSEKDEMKEKLQIPDSPELLSGEENEMETENQLEKINLQIKERQKIIDKEMDLETQIELKEKNETKLETGKKNYQSNQKKKLDKLKYQIKILKQQIKDYTIKECCLKTDIHVLTKNLEYFQNFMLLSMSLAYRNLSNSKENLKENSKENLKENLKENSKENSKENLKENLKEKNNRKEDEKLFDNLTLIRNFFIEFFSNFKERKNLN